MAEFTAETPRAQSDHDSAMQLSCTVLFSIPCCIVRSSSAANANQPALPDTLFSRYRFSPRSLRLGGEN